MLKKSHIRKGSASSVLTPAGNACVTVRSSPNGRVIPARAIRISFIAAAAIPPEFMHRGGVDGGSCRKTGGSKLRTTAEWTKHNSSKGAVRTGIRRLGSAHSPQSNGSKTKNGKQAWKLDLVEVRRRACSDTSEEL
eukprot:3435890-Rhodomonas_salina.1